MSVYVDALRTVPASAQFPSAQSCHMFADTLRELNAMAVTIGMSTSWLQVDAARGVSFWHYDLTPRRRMAAIAQGAIEVRTRDYIREHR